MNKADDSQPQICCQNLGETQLPYLLYEGEGPPLIMLHATGFSPWLWHPLAGALARSFRVVAPSLCNHRHRDPRQGGISWALLAEDIVRLCEAQHLEHPYLVGHSMGATIQLLAHGHLGLPAAALVLIEPVVFPEGFYRSPVALETHPFAVRALQRTNHWHDIAEARAYLHSRPLFQGWTEAALDLYLHHDLTEAAGGGLHLACPPEQEAALFLGGTHLDPGPSLARVACPVLLLEGAESELRGMLDFERVCSLLPACEHRRIQGAGHLIPMERPDAVRQEIETFLAPLRAREEKTEIAVREAGAPEGTLLSACPC